jgi:membrane-bound lytic murein transglycosylase D
VTDLKKINNLKSGILKIGQTIRFAQKEDKGGGKKALSAQNKKSTVVTYKVKKGDNLARIAKKNGVNIQKLLTLNKMTTKDDLHPGQEIVLQ